MPKKTGDEITLLSSCVCGIFVRLVRDIFAHFVRDTFACGQMISRFYRTKNKLQNMFNFIY